MVAAQASARAPLLNGHSGSSCPLHPSRLLAVPCRWAAPPWEGTWLLSPHPWDKLRVYQAPRWKRPGTITVCQHKSKLWLREVKELLPSPGTGIQVLVCLAPKQACWAPAWGLGLADHSHRAGLLTTHPPHPLLPDLSLEGRQAVPRGPLPTQGSHLRQNPPNKQAFHLILRCCICGHFYHVYTHIHLAQRVHERQCWEHTEPSGTEMTPGEPAPSFSWQPGSKAGRAGAWNPRALGEGGRRPLAGGLASCASQSVGLSTGAEPGFSWPPHTHVGGRTGHGARPGWRNAGGGLYQPAALG